MLQKIKLGPNDSGRYWQVITTRRCRFDCTSKCLHWYFRFFQIIDPWFDVIHLRTLTSWPSRSDPDLPKSEAKLRNSRCSRDLEMYLRRIAIFRFFDWNPQNDLKKLGRKDKIKHLLEMTTDFAFFSVSQSNRFFLTQLKPQFMII